MRTSSASLILLVLLLTLSCKKEETIVFSNNVPPPYGTIPVIRIENYVNRLFIDLIGREPTNSEMIQETNTLRQANLSPESRTALVQKLMDGDTPSPGSSETYAESYFRKLYEDQKGRFLEGASEGALLEEYSLWRGIAVLDSLNGNMIGYEFFSLAADKVQRVLNSREELASGAITIAEMCRRMMFNSYYDNINMNSFNFINATFDDCLFRFPTSSELNDVYPAIELNLPGVLFGQAVTDKAGYLTVMISTLEFREGMVRWAFRSLLSRDATSVEVMQGLQHYGSDHHISLVQQHLLITDEYAGFD